MSGNIEGMSRGTGIRATRARLAAATAAWLCACSAGVDGYHLVHERDDGSVAGDGGATAGNGGSGNAGVVHTSGGGATVDGGSTSSGGSDVTGGKSNGGTGDGGAGGGGNDGGTTSNGGTGSGGIASGGMAGKGGTTTTGGTAGNGGTSSGGTLNKGGTSGAGGTNTGGTSSGGTSTGGMTNTGGSGGLHAVALSPTTPTGIVAAAWASPYFYMLQAGATNQFWKVSPEDGTVLGPYALPADSSMSAIGASGTAVFAASKTKVYMVPSGGSSTATSTGSFSTTAVAPVGAYAKGYFLVGDAANGGSFMAQAMNDAGTMVSTAKNLGAIHQVASDGTHFAFATVDINTFRLHVVDAGTFTPNTNPCSGNAFTSPVPISVAGYNVGWVYYAGGSQLLKIGPVSSGTCGTILNSPQFGMSNNYAVGMINGTDALVVSAFNVSSEITLLRLGGGMTLKLASATSGYPQSIIVANGVSYAAVVTTSSGGGIPTVLGW